VSFRATLAVVAAGSVMTLSAASCGRGGTATPTGRTGTAATAPRPEHPVVIRVNGKPRVVTLSKVDFAYCRRRTDVCAAIRGANLRRLSPLGRRAALQARRRKRARQAAVRAAARRAAALEAARREAARREIQNRQRYQPGYQAPPTPQPQPEGTTTG
jgi:hypothetical protein